MNPLILDEFGSRLSVSHFRLVVNGREFEPRQFKFDSVVVLTHAFSISGEAIRWLGNHKVPLFVLDWHGKLQSSILHSAPSMGKLRIAQYRAYTDPERRGDLALEIVKAKARRQGLVAETLTDEAATARVYWAQKGEELRKLGYEFRGRRNGWDVLNWKATSIPNALLNYGYSILEATVRQGINEVGLDSSIGFLHHSRPYGDALVFDLEETFRPDVDKAVLRLLGTKPRITERDLTRNADDYSLRLKPELARRLIVSIQENLDHQEVRDYIRDFARGLEVLSASNNHAKKPVPTPRLPRVDSASSSASR